MAASMVFRPAWCHLHSDHSASTLSGLYVSTVRCAGLEIPTHHGGRRLYPYLFSIRIITGKAATLQLPIPTSLKVQLIQRLNSRHPLITATMSCVQLTCKALVMPWVA